MNHVPFPSFQHLPCLVPWKWWTILSPFALSLVLDQLCFLSLLLSNYLDRLLCPPWHAHNLASASPYIGLIYADDYNTCTISSPTLIHTGLFVSTDSIYICFSSRLFLFCMNGCKYAYSGSLLNIIVTAFSRLPYIASLLSWSISVTLIQPPRLLR